MSEKSLTLLELHLDDGRIQIGPRSLSTGRSTREEADGEAGDVDVIDGSDESADGDGADTGGSAAKALLALLVVATLALAAWKLLGGEDLEAVEELDELA